jgi:hypothetical protein
MARLAVILKALATCVWRRDKSFGSVASNNLFLFTVILLRQAGAFIYVVLSLILFFPLCTDPLRNIPPERLGVWPLDRRDRWLLRAISPWTNPMTWLIAALVAWAVREVVTIGLLALFALIFLAAFLLPALPGGGQEGVWRRFPGVPGRLGELTRKNVRELISTLDFYMALTLSLSGAVYRMIAEQPQQEARLALALLIVLALSSFGQSLFGLDGHAGMTRYRLLPMRGWEILAAKDVALLALICVLTLPLAPLAGLAAGLGALAVGHAPSVNQPREQIRWRFSSGASFDNGVLQLFALSVAGVTTFRLGALVLIPCAVVYVISLWWFGRILERTPVD